MTLNLLREEFTDTPRCLLVNSADDEWEQLVSFVVGYFHTCDIVLVKGIIGRTLLIGKMLLI